MSKKKMAMPVAMSEEDVKPVAAPVQARRRRRRRRTSQAAFGQRTIADIKRKEREFLREVSRILTDALGFPVRVSHVKVHEQAMTPRMRTFAHMSKAKVARQLAASFNAGPLNDPLPF